MRTALAFTLLAVSGCAQAPAPAMSPRADGKFAEHAPGTARFVFTRHASGCDTSDHAVVVDESGAFVGALRPDTAFAMDVPPGRHAFFVWPGMDLRNAGRPDFRPVAAIEAEVAADESRVINVLVFEPPQGRGRCFREAHFYFEKRPNDVAAETANLRIVEADRASGQGYLREHRELSSAYFTMGQDRLARRRAAQEDAARRAEQAKAIEAPH